MQYQGKSMIKKSCDSEQIYSVNETKLNKWCRVIELLCARHNIWGFLNWRGRQWRNCAHPDHLINILTRVLWLFCCSFVQLLHDWQRIEIRCHVFHQRRKFLVVFKKFFFGQESGSCIPISYDKQFEFKKDLVSKYIA